MGERGCWAYSPFDGTRRPLCLALPKVSTHSSVVGVLCAVCLLCVGVVQLVEAERVVMPPGSDPVSKAVYKSVLRYARRFDQNIAAKVQTDRSRQ